MKSLGLRAKRAEVGAQSVSVLREKERIAKESGICKRGCVWGGFPSTHKGDVGISSLIHRSIIMESCPCGGQAKSLRVLGSYSGLKGSSGVQKGCL